jgi:protein-disulfide isomerase
MNEGTIRILIGISALVAGAFATAVATGSVPAATTAVRDGDRAAIEKIVREYILEHPEILPEAMQRLQERELAKAVNANRKQIETPFAGAWEGAAQPDVTVVEFFDYNCGYCRAALGDVDRLLKEDPKLRIVYREFPVLGPDSEVAARASLAAAKAGKYPEFHRALFAGGRVDAASVTRVARSLGIDPQGAGPAAQAEIDANLSLQRPLDLRGTPSWVIGTKVFGGAVGYDTLKAAIAEARAKK